MAFRCSDIHRLRFLALAHRTYSLLRRSSLSLSFANLQIDNRILDCVLKFEMSNLRTAVDFWPNRTMASDFQLSNFIKPFRALKTMVSAAKTSRISAFFRRSSGTVDLSAARILYENRCKVFYLLRSLRQVARWHLAGAWQVTECHQPHLAERASLHKCTQAL